MKRNLASQLLNWKTQSSRKPVVLYGARQVGKTWLLKDFGRSHFQEVWYLNFEEDRELKNLFEKDLRPERILSDLELRYKKKFDPQHDLLIFDEIQSCPDALTSLKYFSEKMPEIFLAAAGSLLGVRHNAGSFPVGKVTIFHLDPLSFEEFLRGIDEEKSANLIANAKNDRDISPMTHSYLWNLLKTYFVVGGLPEVVSLYKSNKEHLPTALQHVRQMQKQLILNYQADIAKHCGKINAMHIERVWSHVPSQLASSQDGSAKKFKFRDVVSGIRGYERLAGPIDWLVAAGLVIKVSIVESANLPLGAYRKENTFKLFMMDIGLLGAMSQLDPSVLLNYDFGTYKGFFAENFVAQEFLANDNRDFYCWNEGTAEIEFLRVNDGKIFPIEVKSGFVTKSKSLKFFAEKYNPEKRYILSGNPLHVENEKGVYRYPLYMAGKI